MVYVVENTTKEILMKLDAWDLDFEAKIMSYAVDNNYVIVKSEITPLGNMVVTVKEA